MAYAEATAQQHPLGGIKYRPDVDGLRAVAVLSVIGFHAFPTLVKGGFVGVDVFFVISGFLISSLILERLDQNRFTFQEFYARRIKRIFPALALVLAASLLFGWSTLLLEEYKQLSKHTAAGAGFVSNFFFWQEAGYFDGSAVGKPLLHLWSLGIEEQFYIVWPLFLYIAYGYRLALPWIAVGILFISFMANVHIVHDDAVQAFYSPITRFWELTAGSILAWLTLRGVDVSDLGRRNSSPGNPAGATQGGPRSNWVADVCSLTGAAFIGVAVFLINSAKPFPGWWALLPALGTYLIISAGPRAWLNQKILSHRVLVWFGLISYPLYLWHWPLLSFSHILSAGTPSRELRLALIVLSIGLAWLTYVLVEKPIRFRNSASRTKVALLCSSMMAVGLTGYLLFKTGDARSLTPAEQKANALARYDYLEGKTEQEFWGQNSCFLIHEEYTAFEERGCLRSEFAGRPTALLIGDSHSAYLADSLRSFFRGRNINFGQFSSAYCTPLNTTDTRERCAKINNYILGKVAQVKPEIVVVFGNYQWTTLQGYKETVPYEQFVPEKLSAIEKSGAGKIILVGQMPTWQDPLPKILARKFLLQSQPVPVRTDVGLLKSSLDWDSRMRAQTYSKSVTYLSLKDLLCSDQGCLTYVGDDPEKGLIVFDYGHLTQQGAEYIVRTAVAPLVTNTVRP